MTEQVNSILTQLGRLAYEEVAAFVFTLDEQQAQHLRRSSKKADRVKGETLAKHIRGQRRGLSYERLRHHLDAVRDVSQAVQQLPKDDQFTVSQVARALLAALQPVERRRKRRDQSGRAVEEVARGRVEAKYIRVPVYDPITGERLTDDEGNKLSRGPDGIGPYLYIRIWATGGGWDRRLKRLKSKYVGLKGLAIQFESMEPGGPERIALVEEILNRYQAGALRQWAAERWPDPEHDGAGPTGE